MPLFPALTDPNSIPTGDMPGDKVHITDWHLAAAATLYPALREQLDPVLAAGRAVVAVYGGSGVGKSELGSLLGHALNADGIGAYILSGDNYPRRIPSVNDAERLRVFRHAGVRGLVDAGAYDASVRDALSSLQAAGTDADPAAAAEHPWLPTYLGAGSRALAASASEEPPNFTALIMRRPSPQKTSAGQPLLNFWQARASRQPKPAL